MGDVQAVLQKGEELMELDREADKLRKEIVEAARWNASQDQTAETGNRKQKELVEKVANEKGQEWGWSWSWGFPRPFDEADNQKPLEDDGSRHRRACRRWRRNRDEADRQAEEDWEHFSARWEEIKRKMNQEQPRIGDGEPRVWRWSFHWPPPADAPSNSDPANERSRSIPLFDELGNMIFDEVTRMMLPRPFTFSNESYSPRTLEDNVELKKAGVQWRDAFEDLVRAQQGAPLIPKEQIGQSSYMSYNQWVRRFWDPDFAFPDMSRQDLGDYSRRVPWEGEKINEEPSYEYGHDHEDQHDDPPTPKLNQGRFTEGMPETELEAYERLLGPNSTPGDPPNEALSSILSTLTTTERTVAPDGSVTTKVVLKKRFADGREESSETLHTQRGQDVDAQVQQDPWKIMQEAQFPSKSKNSMPQRLTEKKALEKKSGWFWSN